MSQSGRRTSSQRIRRRFVSPVILVLLWVTHLAAQAPPTKLGGVCFRVDDNQDLTKLDEYTRLFNKYGLRYSISLNLGAPPDAEYLYAIPAIQAMGHEIMDHTPNHVTHYFTVHDTAGYTDRSGVDHITGNKVFLRYSFTDSANATRSDGLITIEGNRAISRQPGAFAQLVSGNVFGLYFPSLRMLTNVISVSAAEPGDVDTAYLRTYWYESLSFSRPTELSYHAIGKSDIQLPDEALVLLAERTKILSAMYSIAPARSWIQPGGPFPQVTRAQAKSVLGGRFGFVAAAVYPNSSLQAYGEYDPNRDAQFGMMWGDFLEDTRTFDRVKNAIADRVAKHYMVIGHSHFTGLLGGWEGYMARMDSLLAWLGAHADRIPVATYSDWAERLYGTQVNPYENIFPPLNVDLDENHYPDGYHDSIGWTDGVLDTLDGMPSAADYSYAMKRAGSICYVSELAGLEKGESEFSIWTKGSPKSTIEVQFRFSDGEPISFKFPADSGDWKEYTLSQSINGTKRLFVPDTATSVNIRILCTSYGGGTVKISGMSLRKKPSKALEIVSVPPPVATVGTVFQYCLEVQTDPPKRSLQFELTSAPDWLDLDPTGILSGTVPSTLDEYPIIVTVRDGLGHSTVQQFNLKVISAETLASVRFLSVPDTVVTPKGLYAYRLAGTSLHFNDQLTYKKVVGPGWLSIIDNEWVTGFAPDDSDVVPVVLKLQDEHGNIAYQRYQLRVASMVVDNFEESDPLFPRRWHASGGLGDISTVYDSVMSSKVLKTQSFTGETFRADRYGMWNASTFTVKASPLSDFTFYVWVVDTTGKSFYVQYRTGDGVPSRNAGSVVIPIGTQYRSGWHQISRDINEDLRSAGWDTPIEKITMFSVRGSVRLDDLSVGSTAGPQAMTPILNLPGIPTEFSVSNAFPNPFNATTSVMISLDQQTHVSVRVYNELGQLVSTLIDNPMPSGRFLVHWNADRFASSTYFFRIGTGASETVRKILLLK